MKTHYTNSKLATTDSSIFLDDARKLITTFSKVLANFDRRGTDAQGDDAQDFERFYELLYGSGMVMSDFNGPLFDLSIGQLIFNPVVAPVLVRQANLLTIRMFLHTLARGYRATEFGGGYPYFDRAYRSGGLREIFNRLERYYEVAADDESKTLYEEIDNLPITT
jgi:hypothetical protein